MNNLKERNPVPNSIQGHPKIHQGLSTPHIGPQRQKPTEISLLWRRSHQDVAYVSSSVGGSVSTLSFEDTTPRTSSSPPMRRGGGIRDRVRGFSRASRRNLLRRLASINRSAFRAFKGRMIFVTLTYPHEYPEDPELCKRPPQSPP